MRIRKSLASGAAVAAAAALVLTACGGGQTSSTPQTSGAGPTGEINVGVAYATADYGPVTTSALALGTNWHVLEGLYARWLREQGGKSHVSLWREASPSATVIHFRYQNNQ